MLLERGMLGDQKELVTRGNTPKLSETSTKYIHIQISFLDLVLQCFPTEFLCLFL